MNMQCFLPKKLPSPTIVDENQKLWESKPNFKIKLTLQTYVKPYFLVFEEGDIGGYPILQYRKKNWQIYTKILGQKSTKHWYCIYDQSGFLTRKVVIILHVSLLQACTCMHQQSASAIVRKCEKTWNWLVYVQPSKSPVKYFIMD